MEDLTERFSLRTCCCVWLVLSVLAWGVGGMMLAPPAQAACTNSSTPWGIVYSTTDPHVYRVYTYDGDNTVLDNWVRLFFHAGSHSRSVYVHGDGAITLPSGTTSIYAVNIDSCGQFVGTTSDTWLKTVVVN